MKNRSAAAAALRVILSVTAATGALAHPAFAQQVGTSADPAKTDPAKPDAARDDEATSQDEITVTGSRIQRSGFDTPTPVTVIDLQDLQDRGQVSISAALQQLPSVTATTTSRTTGLLSGTGSGNFLNMRNLGTARTLVLIDGQRITPTYSSSASLSGSVNLNIVPAIAIGRVDVVTGGASAAYGSDAVAGVANVIFDHNFTGIRGSAQYGLSQRGDSPQYSAAFMVGNRFAGDRGHFIVAAEWEKTGGINDQSQREWGRKGYQIYANPANTSATDGIPFLITRAGVTLANATYGGVIVSPGLLADQKFGPGGTVSPFVGGTERGPSFMVGGDGAQVSQSTPISVPQDRLSFLASVKYEVSDAVEVFGNFLFSDSNGAWDIHPNWRLGNITIASGNPYIPASIQSVMTANNIGSFRMGRINRDFGEIGVSSSTQTYRASAGVRGTIAGVWKWDASAQYSRQDYKTLGIRNVNVGKLDLATDAVRDSVTGNIVCRAARDAASLPAALQAQARACVPINLFGEGSPSAAAINYVTGTSVYASVNTMTSAAANIQRDLFSLWSKPITIAVGGEYREERLDADPDALLQSSSWAVFNNTPIHAGLHVKEAYVEVNVPVAADRPFFKSLELNGAARYTDYSTSGTVATWKVGAVWEPISSLRFRGTISRDIRAPNLRELFSGQQVTNFAPTDPCDATFQAANPVTAGNCAAAGLGPTFRNVTGNTLVLTEGNVNLDPEKAITKTAGVSFSPDFLPGLRMAVDWYQIKISGAIAPLGPQAVLDNCYNFSRPVCDAINRDANGQLVSVRNTRFNTATQNQKGIDGDLFYDFKAPGLFASEPASVTARVQGSLIYSNIFSPDGIVIYQAAGDIGRPKLFASGLLSYDSGRVRIVLNERYVGPAKLDNTATIELYDDNFVEERWYTDFYARYTVGASRRHEVFAGIYNLFDKSPPVAPSSFLISVGANGILHDVTGRWFYAGARFRF